MASWEKVLLALMAIGLLFWFFPRVRQSIKHGPKGSSKEWLNLAFIIGLVVLFVLLLIKSV